MTFIYALLDSLGNVRYVGRTVDPKARLRKHMIKASERSSTHALSVWINSEPKPPEMKILIEGVNDQDAQYEEDKTIGFYRQLGCDLMNTARSKQSRSVFGDSCVV